MIKLILLLSNLVYADGNPDQCEPKVRTVVKYVYRDRIIKKEIETSNKNRLFLTIGNGPSDSIKIDENTVNTFDTNFIGVGYMRDFGKASVGAQIDSSHSLQFNVGVNW